MSQEASSISKIQEAVGRMRDPETGRPLNKTGQLGDIQIQGTTATCTIKLSTHSSPVRDEYSQSVTEAIRAAAPELVPARRQAVERLGRSSEPHYGKRGGPPSLNPRPEE